MSTEMMKVAVCGAHMSGLPLNVQLTELGGSLVEATKTANTYKLYKLNGFTPARPGLIRVNRDGVAIDVEVWQLPIAHYGPFVSKVPAPLGFGRLTLCDGTEVNGFLCEAYATEDAEDISHLGSWRTYLSQSNVA